MTENSDLLEEYEDALFKLLMARLAEEEGKSLLDENKRLNDNPEAAIPESLDKKCRQTIKKAFIKNKRHEAMRILRNVLNKVAIIVFISVILYSTAYAVFPEVRVKTLNVMIEVSDVATLLSFSGSLGETSSVVHDTSLFGYAFPTVPAGFIITSQGEDSRSVWYELKNAEGAEISLDVGGSVSSTISVDTEDSESVEDIIMHGFKGLLVQKGARVHIIWGDTEREIFVTVSCNNLSVSTALDIAQSMHPDIK